MSPSSCGVFTHLATHKWKMLHFIFSCTGAHEANELFVPSRVNEQPVLYSHKKRIGSCHRHLGLACHAAPAIHRCSAPSVCPSLLCHHPLARWAIHLRYTFSWDSIKRRRRLASYAAGWRRSTTASHSMQGTSPRTLPPNFSAAPGHTSTIAAHPATSPPTVAPPTAQLPVTPSFLVSFFVAHVVSPG